MKVDVKSFEPVTINILNDKKFQDIAFLVDRTDFIEDMLKIRKKFNLLDRLPDKKISERWDRFPWNETGEQMLDHESAIQEYEDEIYDRNYIFKLDIQQREKLQEDFEKADRTLPSIDFKYDTRELREKYRRPSNFDRIIANAVIFNRVDEEDYVTCEMKYHVPEWEFVPIDEEPAVTMIIHPLATQIDIEKLFRTEGRKMLEKYKGSPNIDFDTKGNIRRDREWFWKNKKGKGYGKIWKEDSIYRLDSSLGIRNAIKTYEKRLKVHI